MFVEVCVICKPVSNGASGADEHSLIDQAATVLTRFVREEGSESEDEQFDFWDPEGFEVISASELLTRDTTPYAFVDLDGTWIHTVAWDASEQGLEANPDFDPFRERLKKLTSDVYAVIVWCHI